MSLLQDFGEFTVAVFSHWSALATGGIVTVIVFVAEHLSKGGMSRTASALGTALEAQLERMTGGRPSRPVSILVFVCSYLLAATFLAWRGERVQKPGPQVRHYDTVIRADQDWRLVVHDKNNPNATFTVLIGGQHLWVIMENRRGVGRTGIERTVRVEPPMGTPPPSTTGP